MQFTIDSAKRNYLLQSNLRNKKQEEKISPNGNKFAEGKITMSDKVAALIAGAAISSIVSNLKQANSSFFLGSLGKITALPNFEETQAVSEKIVEKMKAEGQQVRVIFAEENNTEDTKKIADIYSRNALTTPKKYIDISNRGPIARVVDYWANLNAKWLAKGKKATFFVNEKVAVVGKNAHQMIFHELGHAQVANNKVLRPILTMGKKLPILATISGFFALEHTPRVEDATCPKTKWEKTQDYLDNHAGKIAFLTFMPLCVEKYIASKKGIEAAKPYLNKAKIDSLGKLSKVGVLTYFTSALAVSAGIGLGNKVQNNIIKQKESPQDVINLLI